jgi:indole-3-glycerol phosphate synthase
VNALERIVAATREEVERRKREHPLGVEAASSQPRDARSFAGALARPGLSLIAEHKRRSPSAGAIREDLSLEDVVGAYERGGAAALSILTERPNFGGELDDLREARALTSLPLLRKDFVVDPYQVAESLLAGADAVLLIVAAVSPAELTSLHERALDAGLSALVEVHDLQELEVAAATGAQVIGINNRDLTTLQVNPRRTFELLADVPEGMLTVAESGFSRPEQLAELAAAGVNGVLVGEALMRSPDIEAACRALTGRAGNAEVVRRGYAHFAATGDLLAEILAPDFVWDMSHFRDWPEQLTYEGPEGARAFLSAWAESWDQWEVELESLTEVGERVVAVVRQRGRSRASGVTVEMRFGQLWSVQQGKQTRMVMYADPDEAFRAARGD